MVPGEYHLTEGPVPYNIGYEATEIEVTNVGDRAVQVGSNFHFYEANEEGLKFDRQAAYGKHLDIAAGTAIRFEPGQTRTVPLVDFGGKRRCFGFNDRVNGYLDGIDRPQA
jgi:urease subunit beta